MTEPRTIDEKGNATGMGPGEQMHGGVESTAPAMTFGERLVGVDFNPSGDDKVKRLKQLAAEMANIVYSHDVGPFARSSEDLYLRKTFQDGAIRRILDAQMWSVKHITNKH